MLSRAQMGGSHEPPGRPAKLPPVRMLNLTSMDERRRYINLVSSFLAVSNKVIGLVFLR